MTKTKCLGTTLTNQDLIYEEAGGDRLSVMLASEERVFSMKLLGWLLKVKQRIKDVAASRKYVSRVEGETQT